jgi:hypothetical protein
MPNITMYFSNIFEDEELIEKEVSISSNKLFKDQLEFSKKSLQNPKKRGRPEIGKIKKECPDKKVLEI